MGIAHAVGGRPRLAATLDRVDCIAQGVKSVRQVCKARIAHTAVLPENGGRKKESRYQNWYIPDLVMGLWQLAQVLLLFMYGVWDERHNCGDKKSPTPVSGGVG